MRLILRIYIIIGLSSILWSCQFTKSKKQILIFTKTNGFRHASIESGVQAIQALGKNHGFSIIHSEDSTDFNINNLKNFSTVVFLNTTGNILGIDEQNHFRHYIQSGGGFVGIHSAADTEYEWGWYGRLVGAYFVSHPAIQEASIQVVEPDHSACSHLENPWIRTDEWYNYRDYNPSINVLLQLDESSYDGGINGNHHPISWFHHFEGGKAFYTGMGHTAESFSDTMYLQHLLEGILWTMAGPNQEKVVAPILESPPENRFNRVILTQNLDEPMELDVLPNGNIIFVERKGNIKIYDTKLDILFTVAKLPVFTQFEDGLLGLAVDPKFSENQWIYLFYSPPGNIPKQHVSRFKLIEEQLDLESEQVILEIPTQREECCHSGGSLEFGPDGLLYMTVGDDTNPFASDGYAPIDERNGRRPWDAQRTSGNTNDLRGKILRIQVNEDGSYSIPKGNLFAERTDSTRPEIYVMGCRNPFRMSIDFKRNWLFWGDVGPDAGNDGPSRGPKGHDELNLAKTAGNWGWPFSRGNNKAYFKYDFESKQTGPKFDPLQPLNQSPNNSGKIHLPPIQKSLIWYSYDKSLEFPWVGTGGKNPMGGPIYYADMYEDSPGKFPEYFSGKVLFYEWMRDWVYLLTVDDDGQFIQAEPFMPNSRFNNPIDMVYGKNGNLYILEYGESWFSQNLDARLNRIEYITGNRSPVAKIEATNYVGASPLTVQFKGERSLDFDDDPLSYAWKFDQIEVQSNDVNPTYTFKIPGEYQVSLTVRDPSGEEAESKFTVLVGNSSPEIAIELPKTENRFFWYGKTIDYKVKVRDHEDGSSEEGTINPADILLSLKYIPEGQDLTEVAQGHQAQLAQSAMATGKNLIDQSDCSSCHALNKKINGPTYHEIAKKYDHSHREYLIDRVIKGGGGVWGETMMSAHPQLTHQQVGQIVDYLLSLDEIPLDPEQNLSVEGQLQFVDHDPNKPFGQYVLMASYTDKGANGIPSLSTHQQVFFLPPKREAETADELHESVTVYNAGGGTVLGMISHKKFILFKEINLDGLKKVSVNHFFQANYDYEGSIEIHLDDIGTPIVSQKIKYSKKNSGHRTTDMFLPRLTGKHDVYVVYKNEADPKQIIGNTDWIFWDYGNL